MNFIPSRLMSDGAEIYCEAQGLKVRLEGEQRAAFEAWRGTASERMAEGDVALGIRPQHLSLCDGDAGGELSGEVVHVERLGAESFAHLSSAWGVVVARVSGERRVSVGETLAVSIERSQLHLFASDGVNVLQGCIRTGEGESR